MATTRKALNYDLDDQLLQRYYPNPKNYKYAWRKVKNFLCKNKFESRQYSGVVSTMPMSALETQDTVEDLLNEFEWLSPCIQKIDVTSVGNIYDLRYLTDYKNE